MIDRARFLSKAPCGDECALRWRVRGDVVIFRHGQEEKSIDTMAERFAQPEATGWLSEALAWLESLHAEGDDW